MGWLLDLLWIPLLGACAATIGYAVAVTVRVRRGLRAAPPVDTWSDAAAPPAGWPPVCIVIPAHNEEAVVARLVASLLAQDYPALSVVFALDRCTDDTRAEIERAAANDPRFELVEIASCPDDWAGKTHAAHQGVARSTAAPNAELLLFTDADTWFAPYCVRAAVSAMRERGSDMLSLLSTLDAHALWEHALQPAAVMALLRQHPLDRVNSPRTRRAFANGQFMLFDADAYRAIGGHEGVKDDLLEDIAFAYALKNDGCTWSVLPAGGALRCRMYDSRRAFLDGWRRIYLESGRRIPKRLRKWGAEFVLTGAVAPVACALALVLGALSRGAIGWTLVGAGGLALACWGVATARVWRAQGAPAWAVVFAPYASCVIGGVMFAAARDLVHRRTVRWGGRSYTLEPRSHG